MNIVFVLNDPPYGSERSYNGLRLAVTLAKQVSNCSITVFLMADAVSCAKKGKKRLSGITTSSACCAAAVWMRVGWPKPILSRGTAQHDGRVSAGDGGSRQGAGVLGSWAGRKTRAIGLKPERAGLAAEHLSFMRHPGG